MEFVIILAVLMLVTGISAVMMRGEGSAVALLLQGTAALLYTHPNGAAVTVEELVAITVLSVFCVSVDALFP